MAYAWRISDNQVGFNLDEPEEVLLISSYLEAKGDPECSNAPWLSQFEILFFEQAKGVSEKAISRLNLSTRRRGNLKGVLKMTPSGLTDYMRLRDERKVARRHSVLQALASHAGQGTLMVSQARTQLKAMPPPHEAEREEQEAMFAEAAPRMTGEATVVLKDETRTSHPLSEEETRRRTASLAVHASHEAQAPQEAQADSGSSSSPPVSSDAMDAAGHPQVQELAEKLRWASPDGKQEEVPSWAVRIQSTLEDIEAKLDRLLESRRETHKDSVERLERLASRLDAMEGMAQKTGRKSTTNGKAARKVEAGKPTRAEAARSKRPKVSPPKGENRSMTDPGEPSSWSVADIQDGD